MKKKMTHIKYLFILLLILPSCKMRDYTRPTTVAQVDLPSTFMEEGIEWKQAKPNANYDRGQWWKIYNDDVLSSLEEKLNSNNQTIISAEQTYKSSLELVKAARASYLPQITANQSFARERVQATNGSDYSHTDSQSINLNASWEIDLFNVTGYTVDSDAAQAKTDQDNWIYTRLSQQSSLAQYYFEMRALDVDQKMLDNIVDSYKASVKYSENRVKSGISDQLELISFQNSYNTAIQNAENNKITRAQYQHAIAVLIGESPTTFRIKPEYNVNFSAVYVPLMLPSTLIERRPDVARAESLVKQANANLGLAEVAYFPVFSIVGSTTWNTVNNNYGPLFSMPQLLWSVGPQLAMTLFDGGAFIYQKKAAGHTYEAQVASYRSTVLTAFQEVEDQLVAVRYLKTQVEVLKKNVDNNKQNVVFTENQYKHGIVDYYSVLTAKINYYNAVKNLSDTQSIQKSAEVTLFKVLGGGWSDMVEEQKTTK